MFFHMCAFAGVDKARVCPGHTQHTSIESVLNPLVFCCRASTGLDPDIKVLHSEPARAHYPWIGQLSRQLSGRDQELEQALRESQRQVEALERMTREKEALAKERAGLAVQLAAAEREGRTLSEEALRLR